MNEIELDNMLFNLGLLILDKNMLKNTGEVKTMQIFETKSSVFHKDGLFSNEIFGPVGSVLRQRRPGYISLNVPVIHPRVFAHCMDMGSKYQAIASGKENAVFIPEYNDFVLDKTGDTGYEFFIKYLPQLEFTRTGSAERDTKIELINKYKSPENYISHFLVYPAGLRDYEIDSKGRPTQDECNDIYRRVLATAQQFSNYRITKDNISNVDPLRYKLQMILVDLFEYFKKMIEGKHKYMQAKWASRGILNGTRNTITANQYSPRSLRDKYKVSANHTVLGLYQYVNAAAPAVGFNIQKYFITGVINPYSGQATLIDSKTSRMKQRNITAKEKDKWLTQDGINSIYNKVKQDLIKNEPVKVGDDYLAMVYETSKDVYIIRNTDDLPNGVKLSDLRPITYGEMLYIASYPTLERTRLQLTRYPITNNGSTYVSKVYLSTTTKANIKTIHILSEEFEVPEYPIPGRPYVDSMSPHTTHLVRLTADFDGDQMSGNTIHTEEAVDEIDRTLNDWSYYLTPEGKFNYSVVTDTLDYVVKSLTK